MRGNELMWESVWEETGEWVNDPQMYRDTLVRAWDNFLAPGYLIEMSPTLYPKDRKGEPYEPTFPQMQRFGKKLLERIGVGAVLVIERGKPRLNMHLAVETDSLVKRDVVLERYKKLIKRCHKYAGDIMTVEYARSRTKYLYYIAKDVKPGTYHDWWEVQGKMQVENGRRAKWITPRRKLNL